MELLHLQQVLEICREGGFSGAARRLEVAQPTLSKSIARLENEVGVKLFERSGGSAARPTSYGLFVAQRAETLLRDVVSLERELQQLVRGEEGRVRLAVGPITRYRPLPRFLELLGERLPKMRIEAAQMSGPDVVKALHIGDVDLAFGYSEHAANYTDLIRKKLFEDRMVIVAKPGHPALDLQKAGPGELLAYPFALASRLPGVVRWAGEMDREQSDNFTAFMSDDYQLIIKRALHSDHLALGPAFVFEEQVRLGQLLPVNSTLDLIYVCWMLVTPERWQLPIMRLLAKLAETAAKPA